MYRGYCVLCGKRTLIDSTGHCRRGHWAEALAELHGDLTPEQLEAKFAHKEEAHEPADERPAPPEHVRRKLWILVGLIGTAGIAGGWLLLLMPIHSRSADFAPTYDSRTEYVHGVTLKDISLFTSDPAKTADPPPVSNVASSDPVIAVAGTMIGVSLPVSVSARLTYVDADWHTDSTAEVLSQNGPVHFAFPQEGHPWEPGHYSAAILVDGSPAGVADFEVR